MSISIDDQLQQKFDILSEKVQSMLKRGINLQDRFEYLSNIIDNNLKKNVLKEDENNTMRYVWGVCSVVIIGVCYYYK